jgi:hypothetical protein
MSNQVENEGAADMDESGINHAKSANDFQTR